MGRRLSLKLYPFQESGVQRLVSSQRLLLADEMGLGKTVQAIVACQALFFQGVISRALIVCPASLVSNWVNEFQKWSTISVPAMYRGADRFGLLGGRAKIVVSSFDTLSRDLVDPTENGRIFVDYGFDLIIVDEAHFLKNASSQRARAMRALLAPRRWALSGTPLENSPQELSSVLGFLFQESNERLDELRLYRDLLERLKACMLRRTKESVGLELPSKVVQWIPIPMGPQQDAEYSQAVELLRNEVGRETNEIRSGLLGRLQSLRRAASVDSEAKSNKVDFFLEDSEPLRQSGKKLVVFSSMPNLLFPQILKCLGEGVVVEYSGRMSAEQKDRQHDRFLHDEGCLVMCASLRSAGVGLTWSHSSVAYHLDTWWNPQAMIQADDRLHRIGQTQPVLIKRLFSDGSLESAIRSMAEAKEGIFEFVVDGRLERHEGRARGVLSQLLGSHQ